MSDELYSEQQLEQMSQEDESNRNIRRILAASERQTDALQAVRPLKRKRASYDAAARFNAFVKYFPGCLWVSTPQGQAKIENIVPSGTPGFIVVTCETLMSKRYVMEVSLGEKIWLYYDG